MQNSIFRFVGDNEDYFSCGNCGSKQYGECTGNPTAKPCRNYWAASPTCDSCIYFVSGICQVDDREANAKDIFCDDWHPKDLPKKKPKKQRL